MTEMPARECGGGDHDEMYRFGQATSYLTIRQHARLLVVRGRLFQRWQDDPHESALDVADPPAADEHRADNEHLDDDLAQAA